MECKSHALFARRFGPMSPARIRDTPDTHPECSRWRWRAGRRFVYPYAELDGKPWPGAKATFSFLDLQSS